MKIGMRRLMGTVAHDPSPEGGEKGFHRPTLVSAMKVTPRFASQRPGPSRCSTVDTKSMPISLPGSPPTTTSLRPRCRRGVSGVRMTTTCVNGRPLAVKSMNSISLRVTARHRIFVRGQDLPALPERAASRYRPEAPRRGKNRRQEHAADCPNCATDEVRRSFIRRDNTAVPSGPPSHRPPVMPVMP